MPPGCETVRDTKKAICVRIFWYSNIADFRWKNVKTNIADFRWKNSRAMSDDLYVFSIFLGKIIIQSFMIVWYVWQILGRVLIPLFHEQLQKIPCRIGLIDIVEKHVLPLILLGEKHVLPLTLIVTDTGTVGKKAFITKLKFACTQFIT